MSNATVSRARAPNFTREDQEILLDVMQAYLNIIECKKTDNVKLSQKTEAWAKITLAYNANTKNVPRSVENLSCYRNMKSKIKKHHSEAKMNLRDPVEKEGLVSAIELNGEDWDTVAKTVNKPVDVCKAGFSALRREYKKHETEYKKKITGTGGGPPPDNEENPLKKLKLIIEPQVDGLYSIYDGDADLMKLYQETLPMEEQVKPIEITNLETHEVPSPSIVIEGDDGISCVPLGSIVKPITNRQEILKKKRDSALISLSKYDKPTKKSCNESFQSLTQAKSELVKLQTELVSMEISHKKQIQELEIEEIIKKNKFKEEMRQKKLLLLDLEIKKMSE